MTEGVSHASSNPSPNTLSIVNIVCASVCLCVCVSLCESVCLCAPRASEKNTENVNCAGTNCSECSPNRFHSPLYNDKPNCRCPPVFFFTLILTWSTVSFITLYFSFSSVPAGKEQLSPTSVSEVTLAIDEPVLLFSSSSSVSHSRRTSHR